MNLKPFEISQECLSAIKTSKFGALMTDNDYRDGILRTLAHKANILTKKTINVLGLADKTAGHHSSVDNLPPSKDQIIEECLKIINTK